MSPLTRLGFLFFGTVFCHGAARVAMNLNGANTFHAVVIMAGFAIPGLLMLVYGLCYWPAKK